MPAYTTPNMKLFNNTSERFEVFECKWQASNFLTNQNPQQMHTNRNFTNQPTVTIARLRNFLTKENTHVASSKSQLTE